MIGSARIGAAAGIELPGGGAVQGKDDPGVKAAAPSPNVDEAEIVSRCRQGERAAFGELVRLYQDRVFSLCLRLCGDRQNAADVAQETFVRALTSIGRFDERSRFFTWLYRIAVNVAIDERRRRGRAAAVRFDERSEQAGHQEQPAVRPSRGAEPSERMESRERREAVASAIAALDEEFRTVVVLRDVEGLDYARIAEILGVPVGTVKSRLFRARVVLRDRLRPLIESGG